MTLSITTLHTTTLSTTTFSITTLSIMTLSIVTLSIVTLSIMTLSIMTLSIVTLSTMAEHCYAECRLCWLSLMLSVTYKPLMLYVVMLSVVVPFQQLSNLFKEHFKHFVFQKSGVDLIKLFWHLHFFVN